MHDNLLSDLQHARHNLPSLDVFRRRQLLQRIFQQLRELRSAALSNRGLARNRYLNRLIAAGDHSAANLAQLSDAEFARMLAEFEMLLRAMTDIIKTDGTATAMN